MGICEFLFDSQISRNGSTTPEDAQDSSRHCQEMPSVRFKSTFNTFTISLLNLENLFFFLRICS